MTLRPPATPELEEVSESTSGDEACAHSVAGEKCIGADRRAVGEIGNIRYVIRSDSSKDLVYALKNGATGVIGRAGDLMHVHCSGRLIECAQISECATCVDSDA